MSKGWRLRLPRSLFGQVALLYGATALAAAILLPFGTAMLLHQIAGQYQRVMLERQADAVAMLLPGDRPHRAVRAVDLLAGGLTLAVVDRSRHVLAERGPARPELVTGIALDSRTRHVRRGALAAVSRPVGGRWVVVSQDAAAPEVVTDDIVRTFLSRFVWLLLPVTLIVPLVGAWMARRLTRRMSAVSAIAADIGPRTLDRRLPQGTLPAEVEPLAIATNAALDRLEQSFVTQAAFAADVAHELRTPLSVIRLRADGVTDPAVRTALLAEVDRAAHVIAQLLALADLERPPEDAGTPVDLLALAEQVVADRAPMVIDAGYRIALEDRGPTPVRGYAHAIQLAVENLIENVLRHTPPGTGITVAVGPGAQVRVTDDGPPIDPATLAQMTRRFWRGSATRSGGSGLGLSIVARVAAAHDGALHLSTGANGHGLCATVTLERADIDRVGDRSRWPNDG